jgi:hypothetical protein
MAASASLDDIDLAALKVSSDLEEDLESTEFVVSSNSDWIRARICEPFMEPRNRFPAWRAGSTTLFVVPACQATSPMLAESLTRAGLLWAP